MARRMAIRGMERPRVVFSAVLLYLVQGIALPVLAVSAAAPGLLRRAAAPPCPVCSSTPGPVLLSWYEGPCSNPLHHHHHHHPAGPQHPPIPLSAFAGPREGALAGPVVSTEGQQAKRELLLECTVRPSHGIRAGRTTPRAPPCPPSSILVT